MRRNGIHGVYTLLVKVSRKLANFYQSGLAEQKVTHVSFCPSFFLLFPCGRDAEPGVDLNQEAGTCRDKGQGNRLDLLTVEVAVR